MYMVQFLLPAATVNITSGDQAAIVTNSSVISGYSGVSLTQHQVSQILLMLLPIPVM